MEDSQEELGQMPLGTGEDGAGAGRRGLVLGQEWQAPCSSHEK